MTAEQFFELPEPAGSFAYELHFGEVVTVEHPKKMQYDLQRLICEILSRKL